MSCFGKRVDVPGGRRKAERHPVCDAGSAISLQGSMPVVVEDVGPTGARIRGQHLPAIGNDVFLWTDELNVLGSVVWARFGERGIAFDTPFIIDAYTTRDDRAARCADRFGRRTRLS